MRPKLTPAQERMREAVQYLQGYMATYDRQPEYLNYQDDTLIKDVLYGLGVALDREKYSFAEGFRRFKEFLRTYLDKP